jgi:hypothetical protein
MLPEAKKLLSRARALHAEEYIRNEDFEVVLSFSLPVYHPSICLEVVEGCGEMR